MPGRNYCNKVRAKQQPAGDIWLALIATKHERAKKMQHVALMTGRHNEQKNVDLVIQNCPLKICTLDHVYDVKQSGFIYEIIWITSFRARMVVM